MNSLRLRLLRKRPELVKSLVARAPQAVDNDNRRRAAEAQRYVEKQFKAAEHDARKKVRDTVHEAKKKALELRKRGIRADQAARLAAREAVNGLRRPVGMGCPPCRFR